MIPVAAVCLNEKAKQYARECLETNQLSWRGRFLPLFAEKFADYVGVPHAVPVSSGTSALHLALAALGIGPGDDVIVPDLAYVAVANCVLYVGAQPVFVDSDSLTWNIDPACVEEAVTRRTKAIIAVHTLGNPCDMSALARIADKYALLLIEDACEALGASSSDNTLFKSHATVFSFYANKLITAGEGGAVVTPSSLVAERVTQLAHQGAQAGNGYWHTRLGWNYRMTNIQAAMLLGQLEEIDRLVVQKSAIYSQYSDSFGVPQAQEVADAYRHSTWMFGVNCGNWRSEVEVACDVSEIDTRRMFPLQSSLIHHRQPRGAVMRPRAADIARGVLMLPSYPALSGKQIGQICDVIHSGLGD